MDNCKQRLPLGIDDFKKLREDNCYFVDKSLLIKDIIDFGFEAHLLLRPRRFGKTLNLSMIKYFFNRYETNKNLFNGLAITQAGPEYTAHQGRYPVIFLSLKRIKADTFEKAMNALKELLAKLYEPYEFLLESDLLSAHNKARFVKIRSEIASITQMQSSVESLSQDLTTVTGEKTIILIDEYDAPIHHALLHGYEDKMLDFMREFLGNALKTNLSLKFGFVTGILRIAKENLFSGLNNINVYTVLDKNLSQHFAWSQQEVDTILNNYYLTDKKDGVKAWYDGYTIGKQKDLYNPWSILKFISEGGDKFKPYWVNTGNPGLLEKVLAKSDHLVKTDLELLLKNETVNQAIANDLTVSQLEQHPDALWHLLLFSGYLTALPHTSSTAQTYNLKIPNKEVMLSFNQIISRWFNDGIGPTFLTTITKALLANDITSFSEQFSRYIEQALSYFDVSGKEPERFYHAFVLGLLVHLEHSYTILSNRESGFGRYDIALVPFNKSKPAFIIEFKLALGSKPNALEESAKLALTQIKAQDYKASLMAQGINQITALGIAFHGKRALVESEVVCSMAANLV